MKFLFILVQPLHWIYDLDKFRATVGDADEIEFWSPSANAFYCLETGKQSCYGDQTHAVLISLARQKGKLISNSIWHIALGYQHDYI